jgi:hypothetical protein
MHTRYLRTRIVSCLLLAAAGIASTPSSASAQVVAEPTVSYFNNPLTTDTPGAPSAITQAIRLFLNRAYDATTIDIALFELTNADPTGTGLAPTGQFGPRGTDVEMIAQEIKAAGNAGATIRIVLDDDAFGNTTGADPTEPLAKALDLLDGVEVYRCINACYVGDSTIAGRRVNHNKFMLADTLLAEPRAGAGDVQADVAVVQNNVLQMTSNWTNNQLSSRLWNSAVEFHDAALYTGYKGYWNSIYGCATQPSHTCGATYPQNNTWTGDLGKTRAWVFPRVSDPILDSLQATSCAGPTAGVVGLSASVWGDDVRGRGILGELQQLANNGCLVRVVVSATAEIVTSGQLPDPTQNPLFQAHCTGGSSAGNEIDDPDLDTSPYAAFPRVHSKYLLISGTYSGTPDSHMFFMGSDNLNKKSLSGGSDNTWVNLQRAPGDNRLYGSFEHNFDDMFANTAPCTLRGPLSTSVV